MHLEGGENLLHGWVYWIRTCSGIDFLFGGVKCYELRRNLQIIQLTLKSLGPTLLHKYVFSDQSYLCQHYYKDSRQHLSAVI